MAVFQIVLMVLGVAIFAIGYRKTHRNRMLIGTVLMLLAFAIPDFIKGFGEGFTDGFNGGLTTHSSGPINRVAIDVAAWFWR